MQLPFQLQLYFYPIEQITDLQMFLVIYPMYGLQMIATHQVQSQL